jgi:hypothetical protein
MFFNKYHISRGRKRETDLQINDDVDMLDLNDLSEETTLTAKKSWSDRLANEIWPRAHPISVNISLSP